MTVSSHSRPFFDKAQLLLVRRAGQRAVDLVTNHYRIAPREWDEMPYEIRTLRSLDSSEVIDTALAHTLCYNYRREVHDIIIAEGQMFRICLQDHRILKAAESSRARLRALVTYVLTHELVHVVRFGRRLQSMDIPVEQRREEEKQVERTTHRILAGTKDPLILRIIDNQEANIHHSTGLTVLSRSPGGVFTSAAWRP